MQIIAKFAPRINEHFIAMKKVILAATAAISAFAYSAKAQSDLQVYYDFGKDRKYVSSTFETYKADKWGDTFLFADFYFTDIDDRDAGMSSASNGSYFEIERGLNFWQDSKLKDLGIWIEYDGSTWGASMICLGAKYFLHSADFKNTATLSLMYDQNIKMFKSDIPFKFTASWGMQDIFNLKNLRFSGFIDIWGQETVHGDMCVLFEPQLWYCLDGEHLNIGTEIEVSYNFAGHDGFMVNPCLGVKWVF